MQLAVGANESAVFSLQGLFNKTRARTLSLHIFQKLNV
jgi:hypothetical protein